MLVVWLALSWYSVGFQLYESQYSSLPLGTYSVDLISEADYDLLKDRTLQNQSITLSNGQTWLHRTDSFFKDIVPSYEHVGDHYVRVTTKGTSYFYRKWLNEFIPVAFFALWAFLSSIVNSSRSYTEANVKVPSS